MSDDDYGAYQDDVDDRDDGPMRDPVTLVGGPLDGDRVETHGWSDAERATGAALIADRGGTYPGGRSEYGPQVEGDGATRRWVWERDVPW